MQKAFRDPSDVGGAFYLGLGRTPMEAHTPGANGHRPYKTVDGPCVHNQPYRAKREATGAPRAHPTKPEKAPRGPLNPVKAPRRKHSPNAPRREANPFIIHR